MNADADDDVHSARTVPPPAGGDAYADATVVREVPADILGELEPPEEKLGALTAAPPTPRPAAAPLKLNASGLPSVMFEDEDEDDADRAVPSSSPLAPQLAPEPEIAHAAATAATPAASSRTWLIGLVLAAALVMWTLAALK